jgi:hypothetical protein
VADADHQHPQERSSVGRNRVTVAVDLRRGHARELPHQSDLRDAVQAARVQQREAGVTVLAGRA